MVAQVSGSTGEPSSTGWSEEAARDWLAQSSATGDRLHEEPWRIAATLVALDRPDATAVLDVGSGPGGLLEVLLAALPAARGVWLDSSETMREEALSRLAHLEGRVEFRLGDILDLDQAGQAGTFDVVSTSRATHHLAVADLRRFYALAASALRPGGWLVNLDVLGVPEPWDARLREARSRLQGPSSGGGPHHPHLHPRPRLDDHLAGVRAAGLVEAEVVWREFVNALVMARKPD